MSTPPPVRFALFGVQSEKQLQARLRLAQAAPLATRVIAIGPGEIGQTPACLAPGGEGAASPAGPPAPGALAVWYWRASPQLLLESAGDLLRNLVLPLCRSDQSFCVALPLERAQLEPPALALDDLDRLDAEDIGTLLDDCGRSVPAAANGPGQEPCAAALSGAGPPSAAAPHLAGLDAAQREAASHAGGPARVLAPAGAGKTKTMIAHVAHLIATGVPPAAILVLAFNTEAAQQLEERLAPLGVTCTRKLPAMAGAGRRPPAEAGDGAGDEPPPGNRTTAEPPAGVHCATFNAFGFRYQRDVMGAVPSVSTGGASRERALREALVCVEHARPAAADAPRAQRAPGQVPSGPPLDPFDAALSDRAWRLDKLLTAVRSDLVAPQPSDHPLVSAYERRQADANVQAFDDQVYAAVVHLLANPAARRHLQRLYRHVLVDEFQDVNEAQLALLDILSRPWRNLYVVGDDDQLIYGWRNARPRSIVEFGSHRPRISSPRTYVLGTNYRGSGEVVSRADRLIRHNRVRVPKEVRPRPDAPAGAVVLFGLGDWPARMRAVAAYLAAERGRLACEWSDLAVLCRYRAQLDAAALCLRDLGVPASPSQTSDLFTSALATQLRDRLERLLADGGAVSPAERSLISWLRRERPRAVDALDEAVTVLALDRPCRPPGGGSAGARRPGGDSGGAREVLDAARLLAWDHADLASFLARWRRLAGAPAPACELASHDAVVTATVHATKGREYHSVAVVDFAPAIAKATAEEIEEERRVLYVAVTRARHTALVTFDASRAPHLFVRELSVCPGASRPLLMAEERRLCARLSELGLEGLPWDAPSPSWLGPLSSLTEDQGRLLLQIFELRGRLTDSRLSRPSLRTSLLRLAGAGRSREG